MDLYLTDPSRCPDCGSALPPEPGSLPAVRSACSPARSRPASGRSRCRQPSCSRPGGSSSRPCATRRRRLRPRPPARRPPPAARPLRRRRQRRPGPSGRSAGCRTCCSPSGSALLGVAAVIFVAVSWERLGVGGRSAVMAGVTALAGVAASGPTGAACSRPPSGCRCSPSGWRCSTAPARAPPTSAGSAPPPPRPTGPAHSRWWPRCPACSGPCCPPGRWPSRPPCWASSRSPCSARTSPVTPSGRWPCWPPA